MVSDIKVGVLGGGQLGAMFIRHAIDFGLSVAVLDKDPNAPCAKFSPAFTVGDPLNYDDVIAFGQNLDVVTIEREAVNTAALLELQRRGVKVHPSPHVVALIQDKHLQKRMLQYVNVPVVPGKAVAGKADFIEHIKHHPVCLKKCTDGYDGTGVAIIKSDKDIDKVFDQPCIVEHFVNIKHEISVIVARNESGDVEVYDPVLMMYDPEMLVLDFQLCPADIDKSTALEACNIALKIAEATKLVGILAVEMFVTQEGKVLVNELAPRPHNSGHHTIEAATTSQYEQQLRAILNLPLGSTSLTMDSVMVNILEPPAQQKAHFDQSLRTILATPDCHFHWYGKQNNREGRKIGHLTITKHNVQDALSKALMVRHLLKGKA